MYIALVKPMDILIIAATEQEIGPFLKQPAKGRHNFDILVTGIGMVATAFSVGQRLSMRRYDLLLNVGIAGSFDRTIALGDVVHVVQDTFSEMGAEDDEFFWDSESIGLGEHTFHGSAELQHPDLLQLRRCKGITVNRVHGNPANIQKITERLKPDTESMEGAAVLYAAHRSGIPAIQVRAISNYVERRNKAAWQIPLAIANLNAWLTVFTQNFDM